MFCGHCELKMTGKVEAVAQGREPDEGDIGTCLFLVRCSNCNGAVLVEQWMETGPWDHEGFLTSPETLWPKEQLTISPLVPDDLQRAYEEARTCFTARAYMAAAVMVRRTLEGVCAERGVRAKVLMKALQELRDTGMIDGRLFDWAQALRVLGNQGAHFSGEEVSREDAADALALCEALLDYIYVLSVRYEDFVRRRKPVS